MEYLLGERFVYERQVVHSANQSITLYNENRPHLSLNYVSPAEIYFLILIFNFLLFILDKFLKMSHLILFSVNIILDGSRIATSYQLRIV